MPAPTITPLPDPPLRTEDAATFSAKAEAWVGAVPTFVTEANALGEYLSDQVAQMTPTFVGPDAPTTDAPAYLWFQTDANGRARLFVEDGE